VYLIRLLGVSAPVVDALVVKVLACPRRLDMVFKAGDILLFTIIGGEHR